MDVFGNSRGLSATAIMTTKEKLGKMTTQRKEDCSCRFSFSLQGESGVPRQRQDRLLEMIDEYGFHTKAAKAVGISYKTAWDTMDAINNLSDKPLFVRMAGGKSGGGTRLTDEGREVIKEIRVIEEEHTKFLANITKRVGSAHELINSSRGYP